MEGEQITFSPLPRDGHPSAGDAMPALPPHRRLPARRHQRDPDCALPPGASRPAGIRTFTASACRPGMTWRETAGGFPQSLPAALPEVLSRRSLPSTSFDSGPLDRPYRFRPYPKPSLLIPVDRAAQVGVGDVGSGPPPPVPALAPAASMAGGAKPGTVRMRKPIGISDTPRTQRVASPTIRRISKCAGFQ
jgi:hypothetical protein